MRVLLEDTDRCLRVVSACCVEYDSDSQVCRVVLCSSLIYVVYHVSQFEYAAFIGELYEKGFSSLTGHEWQSRRI